MREGIMEWTAWDYLAQQATNPSVTAPAQEPPVRVYFRQEYFAELPGHLLPKVKEIMAEAGGFDYQPTAGTITSLHRPEHYRTMCSRMVVLTESILNV